MTPRTIIDQVKVTLGVTSLDSHSEKVIRAVFDAMNIEFPPDMKSGASFQDVVGYWNSKVQLPKIRAVTNGRLRSLKQRYGETFFRDNYREGIDRMLRSDFLLGRNDTGWTATFDFFIRPDSLAKILEGNYDNKTPIARARSIPNLGAICP